MTCQNLSEFERVNVEVAAHKAHELAEAYIEQKELVEAGNALFATKPPIQSDKVNDKVDIKDPEVNIATKAPEAPEATAVIHIDLTTYNTTNSPTHTDEFKTDSIDLLSLKALIATKAPEAPEALEADNATAVDLTTNITTELSIQSDEVLLNQATAPHHQGTHVRQPTKRAAEAEASRQRKQSRRA